jgi:hypothetical protein
MGLDFTTIVETQHVLVQCRERGIRLEDVVEVASQGETIREYPDEQPYPCYLLLGITESGPLHVLAALDAESGQCTLVTAYWPDPKIWEADFRTKRKK